MFRVDQIEAQLLKDKSKLFDHIIHTLGARIKRNNFFSDTEIDWGSSAGVVMLLGQKLVGTDPVGEACIVLNKRSLKVRQPGDLCFPGGSMDPHIDPYLSRFFSLPFVSLGLWRHWGHWKKNHMRQAKLLSILWATGLRESFEEMRLNPFGLKFLGPLPPQPLVMFKRTIYPMVGWIKRQKRFFPNWEVEKVLYIPIRDLLNPKFYGRYRLWMGGHPDHKAAGSFQDFPCFVLQSQKEILWGATYRITIDFLESVFDFKPPATQTLAVVEGALDETYLTGKSVDL